MEKPTEKLRLSNPIHFLATGFGSGLAPIMPGTIGTIAAIPVYLLLVHFSAWLLVAVILVGSVVGIYLCDRTAKDMQVHDHGSIVWDEFIGFWITMLAVSTSDWRAVLLGFLLFRFFDIIKPWPIRWLDKKVHGGLGIMLDDIVAGIFAAICLYFISSLFSN